MMSHINLYGKDLKNIMGSETTGRQSKTDQEFHWKDMKQFGVH